MEFLEEFKERISKEFVLGYKLKIGLEFQIIDKIENDSIFNINCLYRIYSSNLDNNIFGEENVLLNKTNSKALDFNYLINKINENNFDVIKFQEISEKETNKASGNNNNNDPNNKDNSSISSFNDETKEINLFDSTKYEEENGLDLTKRASKYQILDIIGILGKFNENTDVFIKELSNGWYIMGGGNNIEANKGKFKTILKIYDQDFNKKKELKDINEWIYSCFEIEKLSNQNENDYNVELIACCNEMLYKILLNFKAETIQKIEIGEYTNTQLEIKNYVQMREINLEFIGHDNSIHLDNSFNSQQIKKSVIVSGKSYLGSIKINENIIAITSNKVQYNGEDKLIFYNTDKKEISREIEGYSFISGINGLALMPRKEAKCNNRILLCGACKKYFNDQKNGIYLANPQLEDKQGINNPFYDTGNFEVFCFCPILIVNPDNFILDNGNEKKIIDTEYFFVGGFNLDKKEGEIKLFKVIYSEKASDNKIEFVQDIEFERNKDFAGFEGAVTCIIQTKNEKNGFILVTCKSGKVYLLTKPNLNYYLKKNENSKEIKN